MGLGSDHDESPIRAGGQAMRKRRVLFASQLGWTRAGVLRRRGYARLFSDGNRGTCKGPASILRSSSKARTIAAYGGRQPAASSALHRKPLPGVGKTAGGGGRCPAGSCTARAADDDGSRPKRPSVCRQQRRCKGPASRRCSDRCGGSTSGSTATRKWSTGGPALSGAAAARGTLPIRPSWRKCTGKRPSLDLSRNGQRL